jgi:hypothetical protein
MQFSASMADEYNADGSKKKKKKKKKKTATTDELDD